jgi:ubiquitin-activating enzyme E1
MDTFNIFYYKKIIKLINDSDINWNNGRIKPTPIIFDINNSLHIDFIKITSRLICKILNIKYINNNNINDIINRRIKIDTTPITLINYNIENINEYLDWINIASNIRALNYSIEPIPLLSTKLIYKNKKYKTVSDSTIIAGLTTVELLKHFNKNNKNNIYNNTSVNLILNTLNTEKMFDAEIIKYGEHNFNSWYKFIENEDLLLKDFIKKYNKLFNISISIINVGARILYACFLDNDNINKKLSQLISKEDYILSLLADDESIQLPDIVISI